jgi:hypothetical protein
LSVSYDEVVRLIRVYAAVIAENKEYLTQLDSAIGDADHGINMDRGMQAALAKLDGPPGRRTLQDGGDDARVHGRRGRRTPLRNSVPSARHGHSR